MTDDIERCQHGLPIRPAGPGSVVCARCCVIGADEEEFDRQKALVSKWITRAAEADAKRLHAEEALASIRRDLMTCAGHAADIMEGRDTPTGQELDAIGKQIKLSAICRIAESYLVTPESSPS